MVQVLRPQNPPKQVLVPIKFTFQPLKADLDRCWKVSRFRYDVNKEMGWSSGHLNDNLLRGFVGALGELAAAKIFGIEWDGAALKKDDYVEWRETKADLGPFEVKTINYTYGCLMLKERDKDFAKALLMCAPKSRDVGLKILDNKYPVCPPVRLVGFLDVAYAKKIGTWQSNKWVITQDKLRDPKELQPLVEHFDKQRKIDPYVKSGKIPPFRLMVRR